MDASVASSELRWISSDDLKIQLDSEGHYYIQDILRNPTPETYDNNPEILRILGITAYKRQIKTLKLTGPKIRIDSKEPGIECDLPDPSDDYILPALRHLTVFNASIFLWSHLIPERLTTLDYGRDDSSGSNIPRVEIADFMKVLARLKQLEELTIRESLSSSRGPVQQIHLLRLKKLHVELMKGKHYKNFMDHITPLAPSVQLEIKTIWTEADMGLLSFESLFTSSDPFYKFQIAGLEYRGCILQAWSSEKEPVPSFRADLMIFNQGERASKGVTRLYNGLPKDKIKVLDLDWKGTQGNTEDRLFFRNIQRMNVVEHLTIRSWDRNLVIDGLQNPARFPRLKRLELIGETLDADLREDLQALVNVPERRGLKEIVINGSRARRNERAPFRLLL